METEPEPLTKRAKLIGRRFARAVSAYDEHAIVQKQAALRLGEWIASEFRRASFTGLEFGCGTGFLSGELIKLGHHAQWCFSDLSPEMLAACQRRLQPLLEVMDGQRKLDFQVADIRHLEASERYDLIASSFTLQWISDVDDWLYRLTRALRNDGYLFVNLLVDRSFEAWRGFFEEAQGRNEFFPSPPMFQREVEIASALHAFVQKDARGWSHKIRTFSIEETHEGFLPFLRSLKSIGANTRIGVGDPGDLAQLREWRRTWVERPMAANYEIVEIMLHQESTQ